MSDNPFVSAVTAKTFPSEVIEASRVSPILVDFWADWCGPCKMIAPLLEEISGDYEKQLTIAKLDVDSNQGTSEKYGIRGIPTLMLFKEGDVVATHVGALSKSQLTAFIDGNI